MSDSYASSLAIVESFIRGHNFVRGRSDGLVSLTHKQRKSLRRAAWDVGQQVGLSEYQIKTQVHKVFDELKGSTTIASSQDGLPVHESLSVPVPILPPKNTLQGSMQGYMLKEKRLAKAKSEGEVFSAKAYNTLPVQEDEHTGVFSAKAYNTLPLQEDEDIGETVVLDTGSKHLNAANIDDQPESEEKSKKRKKKHKKNKAKAQVLEDDVPETPHDMHSLNVTVSSSPPIQVSPALPKWASINASGDTKTFLTKNEAPEIKSKSKKNPTHLQSSQPDTPLTKFEVRPKVEKRSKKHNSRDVVAVEEPDLEPIEVSEPQSDKVQDAKTTKDKKDKKKKKEKKHHKSTEIVKDESVLSPIPHVDECIAAEVARPQHSDSSASQLLAAKTRIEELRAELLRQEMLAAELQPAETQKAVVAEDVTTSKKKKEDKSKKHSQVPEISSKKHTDAPDIAADAIELPQRDGENHNEDKKKSKKRKRAEEKRTMKISTAMVEGLSDSSSVSPKTIKRTKKPPAVKDNSSGYDSHDAVPKPLRSKPAVVSTKPPNAMSPPPANSTAKRRDWRAEGMASLGIDIGGETAKSSSDHTKKMKRDKHTPSKEDHDFEQRRVSSSDSEDDSRSRPPRPSKSIKTTKSATPRHAAKRAKTSSWEEQSRRQGPTSAQLAARNPESYIVKSSQFVSSDSESDVEFTTSDHEMEEPRNVIDLEADDQGNDQVDPPRRSRSNSSASYEPPEYTGGMTERAERPQTPARSSLSHSVENSPVKDYLDDKNENDELLSDVLDYLEDDTIQPTKDEATTKSLKPVKSSLKKYPEMSPNGPFAATNKGKSHSKDVWEVPSDEEAASSFRRSPILVRTDHSQRDRSPSDEHVDNQRRRVSFEIASKKTSESRGPGWRNYMPSIFRSE